MDKQEGTKRGPLVRYEMLDRSRFPDLELTVPEVAVLLAVGDEQIRVWARQEKLVGIRYGKEWRFSWGALDALKATLAAEWLDRCKNPLTARGAESAPVRRNERPSAPKTPRRRTPPASAQNGATLHTLVQKQGARPAE